MQILALFFHFPPMSGGGSVVSFDIANTMSVMGHSVTVLVPDVAWQGKRYEPVMHENLDVIRVETPSRNNLKVAARRCGRNLKKKAEEIYKERQFDLVFTVFHPFHPASPPAISRFLSQYRRLF